MSFLNTSQAATQIELHHSYFPMSFVRLFQNTVLSKTQNIGKIL